MIDCDPIAFVFVFTAECSGENDRSPSIYLDEDHFVQTWWIRLAGEVSGCCHSRHPGGLSRVHGNCRSEIIVRAADDPVIDLLDHRRRACR